MAATTCRRSAEAESWRDLSEATIALPTSPDAQPLFHQRDFSALWWGQLVSLAGERATYLALVALIAQHTHGLHDARSAWLLSMLANVMLAPVLLFAPFAGAWIDRHDLRRVVIVSDLLRSALVFAVPLMYAALDSVTPVFVLLFALFTCGVFFLPAKSALTPEIVRAPQLLAANSWLTAAGIAAAALGSLGGGWLVDHFGWAPMLRVNAATYLFSAISLMLIRGGGRAHAAMHEGTTLTSYLGQVREGWQVIRRVAPVRTALLVLGAVWLGGGFLHVAGNLHFRDVAGTAGVQPLGLLMAVLGAGGGVSAWWINTHGRALSRAATLAGSLLLAGAGLVVFALATQFAVLALAALLIGLAVAPALMVTETLLQEAIPPGVRARVFGARDLFVRLVLLASITAAGAITRVAGARTTLLIAGTIVAIVAIAGVIAAGRASVTRAER